MFFFSFPSVRNFDKVKVSANRAKYKKNPFFFISEVQPKFDEAKVLAN